MGFVHWLRNLQFHHVCDAGNLRARSKPRPHLLYCSTKHRSNIAMMKTTKKFRVTFLAMVGGPAAVVTIVIERRLLTKRVILHDPRADVVTFLCLLVPVDNIVELSIHNK